jgi:hypothetical protein
VTTPPYTMCPMYFRRRLTALALGLLLLPLVSCSEDDPESPDIAAGDTVAGSFGEIEADKPVDVVTPAGRLSVAFGEPVQALSEEQTTDRTEKKPPEGGAFVPIVWSLDDKVWGDIARVFGDREPLKVEVTVDGETYAVPPPSPGGEKTTEYLAVDSAGKDIRLDVGYGDLTQTLDVESGELEKGVAAGLYDLAGTKVRIKNCPIAKWLKDPTDFVQYKCQYTTAIPTPYIANTWAKPGHTWLAVNIATSLVLFATGSLLEESIANYDAIGVTDRSTIDGKKPLGILDERAVDGTSSGVLVFDIKGRLPKTMDVLREYKLTLSGAAGKVDAPQRRTARIGGELELKYG